MAWAPRRPASRPGSHCNRCSSPSGRLRAGLGLAGVLGLGLALRTVGFTDPSSRLSVTLLQGNVPQDEKFAIERLPATLGWTRERLLEARGDLVIAPETVIPLLPDQLDPSYWLPLLQHFQGGAQAALIGLPLGSDAAGYTNSAAGISARTAALDGGYYRYDKHHLVPFGEFVPFGFRWFTRMMNIPLGDFNRGPLAAPSFAVRSERVAPNICYEDLFGEELAARFTDAGGRADDVREHQQHRLVRPTPSRSTSTCRSRACARSSSSARCCAPPTPARPRSSTTAAGSPPRSRRTRRVLSTASSRAASG